MIPLKYRLRGRVQLTRSAGALYAVCDLPLAVLRLDDRSVHLLSMTSEGAGVDELSAGLGMHAERVVRLCEYFRSRGLLDVELDPDADHTPAVTIVVPAERSRRRPGRLPCGAG